MSKAKSPSVASVAVKAEGRTRPSNQSQVLAPEASFGPFPLVDGEDAAAYQSLLDDVTRDVAPEDFLVKIFVRDFVDITWEILRLRRLKTGVLNAGRQEAVRKILELSQHQGIVASQLSDNWAASDRDPVEFINGLVPGGDFSYDDLLARALEAKLDAIERIDRMLHHALARRAQTLKDIDRHRDVLARRLQDLSDETDDAELIEPEDLPPTSSPPPRGRQSVAERPRRANGKILKKVPKAAKDPIDNPDKSVPQQTGTKSAKSISAKSTSAKSRSAKSRAAKPRKGLP